MIDFDMRNLKVGDTVLLAEPGLHHKKRCIIIEASETNGLLPVKVRLANPHADFGYGVTEKWVPRIDLYLVENHK